MTNFCYLVRGKFGCFLEEREVDNYLTSAQARILLSVKWMNRYVCIATLWDYCLNWYSGKYLIQWTYRKAQYVLAINRGIVYGHQSL